MARPARPWFRFYVEAFADRKLRRLKPETRWLFAACIGLARQSPDPGRLLIGGQAAQVDDLADFAALTPTQVSRGVNQLLDGGLLTRDAVGVLEVPAFRDRQFESDNVTERTRKHRSKERSNNAGGNAPETEADTDTPPLPPAQRGESAAAHNGQHPNCRACGTSRRPPKPEPAVRPFLPPSSAPESIADFAHHPPARIPADAAAAASEGLAAARAAYLPREAS